MIHSASYASTPVIRSDASISVILACQVLFLTISKLSKFYYSCYSMPEIDYLNRSVSPTMMRAWIVSLPAVIQWWYSYSKASHSGHTLVPSPVCEATILQVIALVLRCKFRVRDPQWCRGNLGQVIGGRGLWSPAHRCWVKTSRSVSAYRRPLLSLPCCVMY